MIGHHQLNTFLLIGIWIGNMAIHVVRADPTYCLCTQPWVYDPTGECHKSAQYGLANVCFNCPVINATGTFNFCGSLPYRGLGACTQPGAMTAMQTDCLGIGGDVSLTSFLCSLASGPNQSQTTGCGTAGPPVSLAPVVASPVAPINTPTVAPTNDAASLRYRLPHHFDFIMTVFMFLNLIYFC